MNKTKAKIHFFRSMASLTEAGIPLVKSLRHRHPEIRKICSRIADGIESGGGTLSEQMSRYPDIFISLECRIIAVEEKTGRLDRGFKFLAERLENARQLRSRIISDLIYPLFLYHAAAIMLPVISFLISSESVYRLSFKILILLSPLYLLLAGIKFLRALSLDSIPAVGLMYLKIPLAGAIMKKFALAGFFENYGRMIEAGIGVSQSTALAATTCSNAYLRNSFFNVAEIIIKENCPLTTALSEYGLASEIGEEEYSILESGEISGTNDESALYIAKMYRQTAEEGLERLSNIIPKLIYFAIVIYTAFAILKLFAALFQKTYMLGN